MERHAFNTRVQEKGESVKAFIADLKLKAATCKFGTLKDEMIRDGLVVGIRTDSVRKLLLREEELTDRRMKLLTSTEANSVKTHKPHQNYLQRGHKDTHKPQESQSPECRNCGYRHARYATCAAQGQNKLCGKLNHFTKVCRSGKKPKPRKSKPGGKVHEFQAGDFPEDPQLPTASNFMIGSITQVNAMEVRERCHPD